MESLDAKVGGITDKEALELDAMFAKAYGEDYCFVIYDPEKEAKTLSYKVSDAVLGVWSGFWSGAGIVHNFIGKAFGEGFSSPPEDRGIYTDLGRKLYYTTKTITAIAGFSAYCIAAASDKKELIAIPVITNILGGIKSISENDL